MGNADDIKVASFIARCSRVVVRERTGGVQLMGTRKGAGRLTVLEGTRKGP